MRTFIVGLATAFLVSIGAQSVQAAGVDSTATPQTFAQLGGAAACNATSIGSRATITDGPASPGWDTSVTAGHGPTTVGIYCDGQAWKVYAGGATTPVPVTAMLPAPATNQGNYGTDCNGGSCLTFDDHWTSASLDNTKWLAGLIINGQFLDGAVGLTNPFSAWTICNCAGGTETVFFDYPYNTPTNTVGANFSPLKKTTDGSLQFTLGANNYFNAKGATYIGAAISSAYTPATEILHTGGIMQWRMKMDNGLQYGSYPAMQCSATGANGVSGTSYNANFEFGYTWTGTALTDVGYGINNLPATTSNGATSSTAVSQVPSTNNLTNWHTFALEYTGDGTRKWQYYVDGVLQDTANATHPVGTDFNCSWQIFNTPTADNGWHSGMSSTNPGPFSLWISDIQFFKKPGT